MFWSTIAPVAARLAPDPPVGGGVLRVAADAQDTASAVYEVAFQIGIGGGAPAGERLVGAGMLDVLPALAAVTAAATGAIVLVARHTPAAAGERPRRVA